MQNYKKNNELFPIHSSSCIILCIQSNKIMNTSSCNLNLHERKEKKRKCSEVQLLLEIKCFVNEDQCFSFYDLQRHEFISHEGWELQTGY